MLAERFNSRANAFDLLRWLFASFVVLYHCWPIGNFGADPLGALTGNQESFGGLAVKGFFIISGFLITRSWRSGRSAARFLWHRVLRIFPAFWACLLVTAVVLSPLEFMLEHGSFSGVFDLPTRTPFEYIRNNWLLTIHQSDVGTLFAGSPLVRSGAAPPEWDGSFWTLYYEFRCYLGVMVLGLLGLLRWRPTLVLIAVFGYVIARFGGGFGPYTDSNLALFTFLFALGGAVAIWADRIPIDDRLAGLAAAGMLATWLLGGWETVGYFLFAYLIFWAAVRVPVRGWARHGDLSYGIYIWAFPLQMILSELGVQRAGVWVFVLVSLTAAHVAAFLSWHLVEKRALALKDWTPRLPRIAFSAR